MTKHYRDGDRTAGDGVNITIANDVEDIYVTVYDTGGKAPLAEHQRLNGFTSISISAPVADSITMRR